MTDSNVPTKSGFLEVSEIHKIYYEVCGNPQGEIILFLHGGPGVGFSDLDKRFFNFEKQSVVFFNQRGTSNSIPEGCVEENTTADLVQDMTKLLDYLAIDKVLLFGGSWGSTLAMIYAIENPNRVIGLLLGSVFLSDEACINHYLEGGVGKDFPKIWKRFSQNAADESPEAIAGYYFNKMMNGTPEEKDFFSYEWAFYELSIFKKGITEEEVEAILQFIPYDSWPLIESYYVSNNYFLKEKYILENANKLDHIPVKIVHGKDDAISRVEQAVELNSLLNNSELFIVDGGHSDSEPAIQNKLKELLNNRNW
jgi:proline iminopeptidase